MKFTRVKIKGASGKMIEAMEVDEYPLWGPVKRDERPDWKAAGLDRDIGLKELQEINDGINTDIKAGIPPLMIGWHTGLVKDSESQKDGELPPPVLGKVTRSRMIAGRPHGTLLVTRPKAIELIEAGLLPKWSGEMSTRPLRFRALAPTHGGRAHFGDTVADLATGDSELAASAIEAEKFYQNIVDSQASGNAIMAASEEMLPERHKPEEAMTEEQIKKLFADLMKAERATMAEEAKAVLKAAIAEATNEIKASLKAAATTDPANSGKTYTPEEVAALQAKAASNARIEADFDALCARHADDIVKAGSPVTADVLKAQLLKCNNPELEAERHLRLLAEAKRVKGSSAPAAGGGTSGPTDPGKEFDERHARGEIKIQKGKENENRLAYVQADKEVGEMSRAK